MRIVFPELVEGPWTQWFGNGERVLHPRMVSREVVQGRDHFMGQRLEILAGGVKRDVGKSRVRGSPADPGEASRLA